MRVGDAMSEFFADTGLLQRKKIQPAFDAWRQAAGEELYERARPVSFRRGDLVIEVDSTALLSELRGFASEDLRTRINAILEETRVRKLTFKLSRRK